MKSMTGFGEAFAENERYRVGVTLRSVNHRFLDLVVRVPEEYRSLETAIAERVRARLSRGRVELRLAVETLAIRTVEVEVREDVLRQLLGRLEELAADGLVAGSVGAADVVRLPQVLSFRESSPDWSEQDDALLRQAVEAALDQVIEARAREGASLRQVLLARVGELGNLLTDLEARRLAVADQTLAALRERIAGLLGDAGMPEERLVQEAVLLVERGDVREELDRLSAHLEHFQALAAGDGPHGRRLEFLVQEIQRELNTLGGKCRDAAMTRDVVDGKLLCEQLREQLVNVE